MAVATGISKAGIGDKYDEVMSTHPTIELYDKDSRPTKLGAYLSACLFYKILTGKKSVSLKYYGDLNKEDAILLQKIAGQ